MLLKNSAIYLLSSLSVGFVSFIAVAVYTRLIEPAEYGKFAIAMAVVNLSDALLFSWLRVSVTRLLLAQHERGIFLSNVIFLHGVMLCLITVGAFVVLGIGIEYSWAIIVLILILVCLRGFVELKFCILQVELRSARFLIANNTRVLSQVVAAILFIIVGLNVEGMLLGYVVGASVAFLVAGKLWALKQTQLNIGVLRKISGYGLPLAFGFWADSFTTMSGRLVLGWLGSLEEAAVFSVSHDTVGWPLQALFMSVNLAGFPLVIRGVEGGDTAFVERQLRQNLTLLFAVALPAIVGLVFIADNFAHVVLGEAFREQAAQIIPWLALAALIHGIRAYYFDHAFLIKKHSRQLAKIHVSTAILCFALNVLLVPMYGLFGAVHSLLIAYAFALALAIFLGRRIMRLPIPFLEISKILASVLLMSVGLLTLRGERGLDVLFYQVVLGVLIYALATIIFNTMGARRIMRMKNLRTLAASIRTIFPNTS